MAGSAPVRYCTVPDGSRVNQGEAMSGLRIGAIALFACSLMACSESPTESFLPQNLAQPGVYTMTLFDGRALPLQDTVIYVYTGRRDWYRITDATLDLRADGSFRREYRGVAGVVGYGSAAPFVTAEQGHYTSIAGAVRLRWWQPMSTDSLEESGIVDGAVLTFNSGRGLNVWVY